MRADDQLVGDQTAEVEEWKQQSGGNHVVRPDAPVAWLGPRQRQTPISQEGGANRPW